MSVLESSSRSSGHTAADRGVDPRGPRFGAAVTTVLLAAILVTLPSPAATVLLAIQCVAFGLGALLGLKAQPYGVLYRNVVRPRLSPPAQLEDPAPPRFAQLVGFAFALVGLAGLLLDVSVIAYIAVGLATAAALLNAVFNFCLGCEVYLLAARLGHPLGDSEQRSDLQSYEGETP